MKSEKIEARTLKGFRDFGSKEQLARQDMFSKIQNVFESFGFLPMSTPVLEYKDILMGKIGEDEKLIYSFKDNGDRDVAMRYDLTVSLARFVAQNQNSLTFPFKRYMIAPVWRAENTQKGRLREFYQCDVDVVGSSVPLADAEVIACFAKALEAVGVKEYLIRINDRRNFEVFGSDAVEIIRSIDKMDKIGIDKVISELEQKGIDSEKTSVAKEYMSGSGELKYGKELEDIQRQVIAFGVDARNVTIDRNIARGLDYYTSTVFEIVLKNNPDFGSITGGGRYDNLVDMFSDKSLPAVGGSIGIDRLFEALESMDLVPKVPGVRVLVINQDESLQDDYMSLLTNIRNSGINSEMYYEQAKMDKQFKYAEAKGAEFGVIMGLEEKAKGVVQVKNLKTREQTEVKLGELVEYLQNA